MTYQVEILCDVDPKWWKVVENHPLTPGRMEDAIENETITLFELLEKAVIVDVRVRKRNEEVGSCEAAAPEA